jgi:heat shock protein HslJ
MKRTYIIFGLVLAALVFAATPAFGQDDDGLAGTSWELVSLDGAAPVGDTPVTLIFSEDGSAGGSAGCNTYGASYTLEGDALTFSQAFSTMMACMQEGVMEQETGFLGALSMVTGYTLADGQLTLTTGDGMELVFAPLFTLGGTSWQVVTLGGEDAIGEITLNFGTDGELNGSGGCNGYSGTYTGDASTLMPGAILSTLRLCADEAVNAQEQAYFQALESITGYEIVDGQLVISYGEGEQIVLMQVNNLANTSWQLVSIGGSDAVGETPVTIEFADNGDVRGNTGCNIFGGTYSTNGGDIAFAENLFTTRRACLDEAAGAQEQAFLDALRGATTFAVAEDGMLTITYGDGQTLVFMPLM